MSIPTTVRQSSLSFEVMLSWFGRFTPQLKLRLMMMSRRKSPAEFDLYMREVFELYRVYLIALGNVGAGADRAREAHQLMDEELAGVDRSQSTCRKGCAACCRVFPKQVTADEADRLAEVVLRGDVQIDLEALRLQVDALTGETDALKVAGTQPCVFLSEENECRVYSLRPGVCRKYFVSSEPEECEKPNGEVAPQTHFMPELILSVLMSLPDAKVGWMPEMLWNALERRRMSPEAVEYQMPADLEMIEPNLDVPNLPTLEENA